MLTFLGSISLPTFLSKSTQRATSKRTVPLNRTAVEMIEDLRREAYFGENTPLVADGNGGYTKPVNLRKRFYRILKAAGIEQKGLHSLRHTFATNLVNGQKQPDGTICRAGKIQEKRLNPHG